jgi:hypothetical protein
VAHDVAAAATGTVAFPAAPAALSAARVITFAPHDMASGGTAEDTRAAPVFIHHSAAPLAPRDLALPRRPLHCWGGCSPLMFSRSQNGTAVRVCCGLQPTPGALGRVG